MMCSKDLLNMVRSVDLKGDLSEALNITRIIRMPGDLIPQHQIRLIFFVQIKIFSYFPTKHML